MVTDTGSSERSVPQMSFGIRRALLTLARTSTFASGDTIFAQEDDANSLYLVRSGLLEVSTLSPDGRKQALNVLKKGDFFGEIALLDGGKRSATVAALSDARLVSISRQVLGKQLALHPELGLAMLALTVERLRWVIAAQENQTFQPLEVRMARRLLYLNSVFENADRTVAISQSDLADHLAVSREATSKCLADWQRKGLVGLGRKRISLSNISELREIAQDYSEV